MRVAEAGCYLYWLVGYPDVDPSPFVASLVEASRRRGYRHVWHHRNPFSVGWSGIPSVWPHVRTGLLKCGFYEASRWHSYWTGGHLAPVDIPSDIHVRSKFDPKCKELTTLVYRRGDALGEAEVWFPTRVLKSALNAGLAEIEWVEVRNPFRGRGWGKVVMSASIREAQRFGAAAFIVWTESDEREDNVAMKRLAERLGFVRGPMFHWLDYDIPDPV